ncbi:uncharacterized protein LOC134253368 [Saccostrea cucullata]|uniref:uncharacterized protein LOC134253368 n=1 Tax=Saccostrea cuccullata TaxID=36930 RepID=UPI002ED54FFC
MTLAGVRSFMECHVARKLTLMQHVSSVIIVYSVLGRNLTLYLKLKCLHIGDLVLSHSPRNTEKKNEKDHFRSTTSMDAECVVQHFVLYMLLKEKKLHKAARSLDTVGFLPRTHGNCGKAPHNSLTVTDRDHIKTFLTKYASDHALPLPGRLPNYKSEKVLLLPSDTTAADIHAKYEILAEEMNFRKIHLRTFQRTWHELCPFITIMKPCTDLCQLCQNFSHQLSTVSNMNDEEKEEILSTYTQHVSQAKQQRDYYRHQCTTSKEVFISLPEECKQTGNAPCTVDVQMHYSWDYAQQVHFPHHAQQVGPIFFKTPRKCNVFGICCEGSGKRVFYLTDEAENTGKGANSVISMNSMLLWNILMMVAGHTKLTDWHFGVWKNQNILPSLDDPLPQEIPAPGLEPKKQWYLYEEICEHCLSLSAKDTSCPKPVVPKKEVKVYSPDHSTSHLRKRKNLLLR